MLKALLWKEWRETRLLFSLMALCILAVSLISSILEPDSSTKVEALTVVYAMVYIFFIVLMAANQFSIDGESGTISFLLSRPVHWFKIWLLKVVYGSTCLMLFGLFIFVMSSVFISPLLESGTLSGKTLLEYTPQFTPSINYNIVLLFISILALYFTGCTVSIIMKSSFKAALVTFLVSGLLCFLTACSFSALYFKDSYYLFWFILPVLLFIIFIRYQPVSFFTRIVYWALPLCGILFWLVTSLKGASLFALLIKNSSYDGFIISPIAILLAFVLPGCCLSAALTSLFAFGIFRRKYPAWWKYLSCWNFLIILAMCFSAFLVFITPLEQRIGVGFAGYPIYQSMDRDTSNSPLVIENSYYFKGSNPSPKNKLWNQIRFSEQHFILNRDKGKVTFFGREKFMWRNLLSVSSDNRWVVYSCPTLKWGVYYTLGLWAENLETSKQYLLMTMNDNNVKTGELLDGGKRFLLINHQRKTGKQSLVLFSITKREPQILNEVQISNSFNLIHIDKMDRLYFHDWNSKLVSCYNRDLVKIYDVTAIQEKVDELKDKLDQKRQKNVYPRIPIISPGGEYMIFSIKGSFKNQNTDNKKQSRGVINQVWYTSLKNGVSKQINDANFNNYYYRWKLITWHPFNDNLVVDTHISKSGDQELRLLDLESGTTKTLLIEKSDARPGIFNFEWSGNGKYFLTYGTTAKPSGMTVKLYAFDLKTHSCSILSSKTNLRWGSYIWSTERSHVAFKSEVKNEIWQLDLSKGKWSKIACPFNNYRLRGISNQGEIYVSPKDKIQIYRLTENQSEIIFQGK